MTATKTTRVRWLLVFWLFVLSAVSYLDRVNISIAGRLLTNDYHLTNIQLGWIFSALLAGYAIFQTPGGRLADKLGSRRVLALGVLWWGVFTALTAAVPPGFGPALAAFMGVRFALGAGEAVVYPASNQFVARWIPSAERGLANGWIFSGVGVGAGFTPPLVTYIMLRHGWRSSFWVCAVLGLFAGLVWYLLARDSPEEHPTVSPSELSRIRSGLLVAMSERKAKLVSWEQLFRSRDVLALTVSYFAFGYVAWIFFTWFFIYLLDARGVNLKASALYSMAPFIAMAVFSPLGGIVGDWATREKGLRAGRCGIAVPAMILASAFLVAGSRAESTRVAVFVLAGGVGALYLSASSFWSVTTEIGGASSGTVSGFMNMGNQFGGILTSLLTPWIAARHGWTAPFVVAAAVCLGGALTWLLVDPERRLETRNA